MKHFNCFVAIIASLISLSGCNRDKNIWESPMQFIRYGQFGAIDCNYLYANNIKITHTLYGYVSSDMLTEEKISIAASCYAIRLYTSQYSIEDIQKDPSLKYYFNKGDEQLNHTLVDAGNLRMYKGSNWGYTLDEVKSIIIRCEQSIFGREPGADISDRFAIFDCFYGSNIWINYKREYLGIIPRMTPLSDYVDARPMAFKEFNICFNPSMIPSEKISDCRFFIEMELANGKLLSAETEPISFPGY